MKVESPLKAELLAIQRASNDGMLHAYRVVEWARTHKDSALYSHFEWDNKKAADEHRLWQARRLIQVHITDASGLPELVSLSVDRVEGGGYRRIDNVLTDKDLSKIMLEDAIKDLERVKERYQRVKELTSVWDEVERVKRKLPRKGSRTKVR